MIARYDLAIAGSGFAGSLMALVARQLGLSVLLLEKGQHPRVVIGESSTPLGNLLLETIAERYDLPWLRPLAKWGTWQESHPELACGLKRGFTFFHHGLKETEPQELMSADRQLLVAASPNRAIADTHWFRADIDAYLVEKAVASGAEYLDLCTILEASRQGDLWRLRCNLPEGTREVQAAFVIDATGPGGLLHQLLHLKNAGLDAMPVTSALYCHFTNVAEYSGPQHYAKGLPPYPPDHAAVHHIFPGGWMWVLQFNNGWTSAGVVATQDVARRFGLEEKETGWARLLDALPEVKAQFAAARTATPFRYASQVPFRTSQIAGDGWAMLPSTAGFADPMLSTGMPLTLLGILRLGDLLQQQVGCASLGDLREGLSMYARETQGELLATAGLLGALYANLEDFAIFRSLTMLYFAAATYAETARRLQKAELATSFLLHTHPQFGPQLQELTSRARSSLTASERLVLQDDIFRLVECFDVAGLTGKPTDGCYPVRASDLLRSAWKLDATPGQIADLLQRSGFAPETFNEISD